MGDKDDLNDAFQQPEHPPQQPTAAQVALIDGVIMEKINSRWAKAALVIAHAMLSEALIELEFSDEIYTQRLKELAKAGDIQVQGNLDRIRFSEVRKM